MTAKDAAEMADAVDKAGVFFTTGYFMRTSPKYLFLKEQIAKGNFGKITRAYAANCHNAGREGEFDNPFHHWFTEENQAGGGAYRRHGHPRGRSADVAAGRRGIGHRRPLHGGHEVRPARRLRRGAR